MNNKSLVSFKIENTCITDTDFMWFDYYVITQRHSQALVSASSFGKDKHFCCGHRTELQFLGKGKSGRHWANRLLKIKSWQDAHRPLFNRFRAKPSSHLRFHLKGICWLRCGLRTWSSLFRVAPRAFSSFPSSFPPENTYGFYVFSKYF